MRKGNRSAKKGNVEHVFFARSAASSLSLLLLSWGGHSTLLSFMLAQSFCPLEKAHTQNLFCRRDYFYSERNWLACTAGGQLVRETGIGFTLKGVLTKAAEGSDFTIVIHN
ncbi:hypothetical protein CEXT_162721 [Caerostris extrusa]|uniref:Secreted protein n=1 Tax=Caerostris extrusa TaxID=172846 RepID=A0AAV4QT72_CAEEX|nr:hypothetical protein CEXT_162721 [Caerostris extrusa]